MDVRFFSGLGILCVFLLQTGTLCATANEAGTDSQALFQQGQNYFKNQKFEKAIDTFEQCLEQDEDNPDYMSWLAKSVAYHLGERGKMGESRLSLVSDGKRIYDLYQKAYKIDPEHKDAKLGYAILKRDLPTVLLGGDVERAEELFSELLESNPKNVLASYHLGKLYLTKRDDFQRGMMFMKRALKVAETKELDIEEELYLPNIHHAIGKAYIDNDEPGKALPYLKDSVAMEDDSVPALIDLARVYTLTESDDEAFDTLKKAIAIAKQREYTYFDDDLKSIARDLGVASQVDI